MKEVSYFDISDVNYALSPIGSYDAKIFAERCSEYNISPSDCVEYMEDNLCVQYKIGDMVTNDLFHALYSIRVNNLLNIVEEAIEEFDDSEEEQGIKDELISIKDHIEEKGHDSIHINACCSQFDDELLNNLDSVVDAEDMTRFAVKRIHD